MIVKLDVYSAAFARSKGFPITENHFVDAVGGAP
jgi:hypothetical protein